jgi:hypothetical protein
VFLSVAELPSGHNRNIFRMSLPAKICAKMRNAPAFTDLWRLPGYPGRFW